MTPRPMSPRRPESEVLENTTANQNIWPGGGWGASLPASGASACLSQKTHELAITGIRWGSRAQSIFLVLEPSGSSQPPWQELIGRVALALPTSTHGNAQLPHLAKGEAPLELVVPFKGKGKLPGKWDQGGRDEGGEGWGDSKPFPGSSVWQKRQPPTVTVRAASTSPAPHSSAPPGPLTLVIVGEVPRARAANQTIGGSSGAGTILCRE